MASFSFVLNFDWLSGLCDRRSQVSGLKVAVSSPTNYTQPTLINSVNLGQGLFVNACVLV